MIGARVADRVPALLLLLVRHVAARAATSLAPRRVLRVQRRIRRLARVTRRALPIIEATRQRRSEHVAIALAVRVVAGRARHAALHVARAREMTLLIRERARPPV